VLYAIALLILFQLGFTYLGPMQTLFATAAISSDNAIDWMQSLYAIGHCVVHGGDTFQAPTLINEEIIKNIRDMIPLVPLRFSRHLTSTCCQSGGQLSATTAEIVAAYHATPEQRCQCCCDS